MNRLSAHNYLVEIYNIFIGSNSKKAVVIEHDGLVEPLSS